MLIKFLVQSKTDSPNQSATALPNFQYFELFTELIMDNMGKLRTFKAAHCVHGKKTVRFFLTNQSTRLFKQLFDLAAQLPTFTAINNLLLVEL